MHPISVLKRILRRIPFSGPLSRRWRREQADDLEEWVAMGRPILPPEVALRSWEAAGRPMPPPHVVKQAALRHYAEKYGLRIFVETGTYYGDMVEAMKGFFDSIYSIELGRRLYRQAKRRFRGSNHVRILHGDSAKKLPWVVKIIDGPALFWLDGHYSGGSTAKGEKDTPIYEELRHILADRGKRHVVVIDDARCFGMIPAYPTLEELKAFVFSKRNDVEIHVQDDSIRITPK